MTGPSMEPLSQNNVGPSTPRPALSFSANPTAALHEGRVVAGEVLRSLPGGGVLVGVGSVRVPARAQVPLEPGQRFMATVERAGEVVLLRVHGSESLGGATALLEALRTLLPSERPIGAVLTELALQLRTRSEGARGDTATALAAQLSEHAFQPGSKGSALAALLQRSGLGLEAALMWAGRGGGQLSEAALKRDLKARLLMARASTRDASLVDALGEAVRSIQAEQAKGLAREAGRDPRCVGLPFPDPSSSAGLWTTAWLTFLSREGEGVEGELGEDVPRLRLDLELERLGRLSAELSTSAGVIAVKLLVSSEQARASLQAALSDLQGALEDAGLTAELRVGVAPRESFQSPADAAGVRFLREHHVLDESA